MELALIVFVRARSAARPSNTDLDDDFSSFWNFAERKAILIGIGYKWVDQHDVVIIATKSYGIFTEWGNKTN